MRQEHLYDGRLKGATLPLIARIRQQHNTFDEQRIMNRVPDSAFTSSEYDDQSRIAEQIRQSAVQ